MKNKIIELPINTVIEGDVYAVLRTLPSNSVHCIVTSPPYWGLRDYGVLPTKWPAVSFTIFGKRHRVKAMECCLGLEPTPIDYVSHMVLIFREAMRVLRHDGTCWLNLGDSYSDSKMSKHTGARADRDQTAMSGLVRKPTSGLKPKDLIGIPWMVAFALREAGWYLRQGIIWNKPNPMPESVSDRCTKAHEDIFLLSKSRRYLYDAEAIMQPIAQSTQNDKRLYDEDYEAPRLSNDFPGSKSKGNGLLKRSSGNKARKPGSERDCPEGNSSNVCSHVPWEGIKANKRSVWTVTTRGYAGAHFATFPPDLIVDCIRAGTPEHGCCGECGQPYERQFTKELKPTYKASYNSKVDERDMSADAQDQGSNRMKDGHKPGHANEITTTGWQKMCKCNTEEIKPAIVLDLFFGSGTTGEVAGRLGRNYLGIELNPKYIKMSDKRLHNSLGLFK